MEFSFKQILYFLSIGIITYCIWKFYGSYRIKKKSTVTNLKNSDSSSIPKEDMMSDLNEFFETENPSEEQIEEIFDYACTLAKSVNVDTNTQLTLYGLYKQATEGDCNRDEPSQLMLPEFAKYKAWNIHKGMKLKNAKLAYIHEIHKIYSNEEEYKQKASQDAMKLFGNMSTGGVLSKMSNSKSSDNNNGNNSNKKDIFDIIDIDNDKEKLNLNEIKKYITTNNININEKTDSGATLLSIAADRGKYDLLKMLIDEFNPNINDSDDHGFTPLHCAAMGGHENCVELLLKHNADKNAKSSDNETPYDVADDSVKNLLA